MAQIAWPTAWEQLGELVLSCLRKRDDPIPPPRVPEKVAVDESEHVVSWVREFRRRHGRDPQIPEVQQVFTDLPRTTAWRRIKQSA